MESLSSNIKGYGKGKQLRKEREEEAKEGQEEVASATSFFEVYIHGKSGAVVPLFDRFDR